MSFIYKIVNNINDKVYVGKTNLTLEERFKEHYRDSQKKEKQNRPLYAAMRKYGIQHFSIIQIEECLPDKASEREQYWIGYYKGYENGYNATKGGDGKLLYDHIKIAKALEKNPYPSEVAKQFNCSSDLVRIVAKEFGITVLNKGQDNVNAKKPIAAYDKKTNILIKKFDSVQLAAEWVYSLKKCLTLSSGTRGHICNAANGKTKSAYGYKWKYI